jgi:hypothetical protein
MIVSNPFSKGIFMGHRWWKRIALGCAVLVSMATGLMAEDQAENNPPVSAVQLETDVIEIRALSDDLNGLVALYDAEPGAQKKYWIGVICDPVPDSLRAHLDLETDVGLVVREVLDDSPAKAAGIRPSDVLIEISLQADGEELRRKLTEIGQLSEVVQKAEKKPLKVMLLQKGKPRTLEVTPVSRPDEEHFIANFVDVNVTKPHAGNPAKVQELLRQLQEEIGGGPQGVRLQMAAPVVVTAPSVPAPPAPPGDPSHPVMLNYTARFERHPLPEGMTLTITKSGNQPARIEVKKGEGQVWGANENEIDTLPEEARALARSAIAGMNQPHFNITTTPPSKAAWTTVYGGSGGGYGTGFVTARPIPPEQVKEIAELHRQLAAELTEKGAEHPEVKRIQAKLDALQKALPRPTFTKPAPPTATKTVRSVLESRPTGAGAKPVPTVTKSTADAQAQIERLQKQVQELLHLQTKQAEAQQQQMRDLQKVLEKLTTKE